MLEAVGSLSKLFSESAEPYIAYRVAENLFCKAFDARNLSRSDASADASKDKLGLGIKTFLEGNSKTLQKIAEFNSEHKLFSNLDPEKKIYKISELRNARLESTKRVYDLDDLIYHCITRKAGKIFVYETPAPLIDIPKIKFINKEGSVVSFTDNLNEYAFNISKSTLYKRFVTGKLLLEIPVKILDDPFVGIERLLSESQHQAKEIGKVFTPIKEEPHIFLPLYSIWRQNDERKGEKYVPPKSGLNQWNAEGRPRDNDEVYIPIPAWIHKEFPGFFPPRDASFNLTLSSKNIFPASVCQDGSKALMTDPNKALGEWLLRDLLNLKEGELLTYEKLQEVGLDSVVIYKVDNKNYIIDFTKIGSYDTFEESYNK